MAIRTKFYPAEAFYSELAALQVTPPARTHFRASTQQLWPSTPWRRIRDLSARHLRGRETVSQPGIVTRMPKGQFLFLKKKGHKYPDLCLQASFRAPQRQRGKQISGSASTFSWKRSTLTSLPSDVAILQLPDDEARCGAGDLGCLLLLPRRGTAP